MSSSTPSWNNLYAKGTKRLRRQDFDGALEAFNEAVRLANDRSYILYDSRADVYEKKNCLNDALLDTKKTIDIAPKQWHGYFRSARLFAALGQTDAASDMCTLTLERLGNNPKHESRRRELADLRRQLQPERECPFLSLPVELMLTIFKISGNPVVISHVCRQWRAVALSQPTLWRSLVLTGPEKNALLKAEEWHKRSHGRIVELNIEKSLAEAIVPSRFGHTGRYRDRDHSSELLIALQHFDFTGIKEIHLEELDAEALFSKLCDSTGFVHQHLESLSISYEYHTRVTFGRSVHASQLWENLRAFRVINGRCCWAELPMRRLTSFEYRISSRDGIFTHVHQFLQANPGLEKLVIEVERDIYNASPTVRDSLTLANLRHVELRGDVPFRIKRGNFSLPSLRILRMACIRDSTGMLSELVKDEGTSFAELVEFTARDCLLGREDLSSLLHRAPKLETLNCTDIDGFIVESLTKPCVALLRDPVTEELAPTRLPILCPALNTLDLSESDSLKPDPIIRVIKERIALAASEDGGRYQLPGEDGDRGVSRIRDLKVDDCPHIKAEMISWFRKNVLQFSCRSRYDLRRR